VDVLSLEGDVTICDSREARTPTKADDFPQERREGTALLDTTPPEPGTRCSPNGVPLSATDAVFLAISFGLAGGYLDLLFMVFKKYSWSDEPYFLSGRDFLWTVPVGHVVLLAIPGVLLAAVNRLRPRPMSLRAGSWLFATLAIWFALLRLPLYGASSLLLAGGLARLFSGGVASRCQRPRQARLALAGLLGLLVILAALSSGRQAAREYMAVAGLPPPPLNARNVVLIVWDTVRAHNLSLYGYPRNTTPNLVRWARQGVRYNMALAPAPWTFPSHSCFFTGQWPYKLNSQWTYTLDASVPTLAEYLAFRGYQTAGFTANTPCCSYETGLDRGFTHYEDYPLRPRSLLGRTVAGSWILRNILSRGDYYAAKWIRFHSRNASGITNAFLDWLRDRQRDRPFFAFLNYFDAHEPYLPPAGFAGRFGIRPSGRRDYQLLIDYEQTDKDTIDPRDVLLARDCYDDCIAFLDEELGRLLDGLGVQGLLDNTLVIITSDHGEAFGDHGYYGHANSIFLDEIAVPLVILSPDAPANRVVTEPVSLRDLPATVVDQLRLAAASPFPGRTLASYWSLKAPQGAPEIAAALSEHAEPTAARTRLLPGVGRRGFQMSLVALGRHYIRDGMGSEQLFDLTNDPFEQVNLMDSAAGKQLVEVFRKMLLEVLTDNPGSIEAEKAYLKPYRQSLQALVQESSPPRDPMSARESQGIGRRE